MTRGTDGVHIALTGSGKDKGTATGMPANLWKESMQVVMGTVCWAARAAVRLPGVRWERGDCGGCSYAPSLRRHRMVLGGPWTW